MTDIPSIWQEVAVGDPDKPRNVIRPNVDGSLNVVGSVTATLDSIDEPVQLNIAQSLQQILFTQSQVRNALLILINLVDKRGNITIDDLQGVA